MTTPCPACGVDAQMYEAWREWHIECSSCRRYFYAPDLACKKRRVDLLAPNRKWERAVLA